MKLNHLCRPEDPAKKKAKKKIERQKIKIKK